MMVSRKYLTVKVFFVITKDQEENIAESLEELR